MLRRTVLYGGLLVAIVAAWVATPSIPITAASRAPTSPQAMTVGTLAANDGDHIYDFQLLQMLNAFIPTSNAHSTLLIFTQCYGGNMLDDFAGRPGTTVLSATSTGEVAYRNGYDNDAAQALRPGAGRTSNDVHAAGVAGRNCNETPQQQGPPASLEDTNPLGEIRSRHILIYAGQPDPEGQDMELAQVIEDNFAGQANTHVTTVGGSGPGSGWDYEGTRDGLQDALEAIGAQMNPNEQFIFVALDHGDQDAVDPMPLCHMNTCVSEPLALGEGIYEDMLNDRQNQPVVNLLSPNPVDGSTEVYVCPLDGPPIGACCGSDPCAIEFSLPIDLNGDGDTSDMGEGWMAQVPLYEEHINPAGEVVTVTNSGATIFSLSWIALSSGGIAKLWNPTLFLPIIQRAAP